MLEKLKSANLKRWQAMTVNPNSISGLDSVAARLLAAKPRYQEVSVKTNVPWWVIAVIHEREASQNWMANLAQGDRWDRVSTHVPRGEGPFSSWKEAAIHALTNDDHLNNWGDWSIGGTLTALEKYNGLGYYNKGVPSPYVWCKTNQYHSGKYVADGVYDPNHVDTQDGCAALLKRMMIKDPSVMLNHTAGTTAAVVVTTAGAVAATQVPQEHWMSLIGLTIVAAIVIGVGVHTYINRHRKVTTDVVQNSSAVG